MPEETTDVLRRRALKASKEKARRSRIKPGYRPRDESMAVRLRREGVSSDAYYSRLRRERLKAEKASDGNSCLPWSPETADLLRRVRHLPGGRDLALITSLVRLVADAPAARAAWGEADPALATLLACND